MFSTPQRRGAGGDFGRLGHHRVAGSQCGRDFPSEQVQRQIPRADAADYAERMAQGVIDRTGTGCAGFHGVRLAAPAHDCRREIAQVADGTRDVEPARKAQRLAVVARFQCREFLQPRFDQVGQALQQTRTLFNRGVRPVGGGAAGGSDSGIDIDSTGIRATREHRGGSRLIHIQPCIMVRRLQATVDQIG